MVASDCSSKLLNAIRDLSLTAAGSFMILQRVRVEGSCSGLILGGSWDLASKVISTLSGVISSDKYSYLNYNPSY